MAEKPEVTLEKKLEELEKVLKPEEALKRGDLAQAVSEAFRASCNKWLINKHGSKKLPDGTEVPLKYSIGDYDKKSGEYKFAMRDVDDMLDYVSGNLLSYVFNDIYKKNPETFKTISKALKDAGLLQGVLADKFGVRLDKLKDSLLKNPKNAIDAARISIENAGENFANAELNKAIQDVSKYGLDIKDKLYSMVEKAFEKKGYGIKTKDMTPQEAVKHVASLYSGSYEPEKVPGSKVYKKAA